MVGRRGIARRPLRACCILGSMERPQVVHSNVIERSPKLTHMDIASDVSSHSSGAFPSGGFKPSYLAGLNSPAFFFLSIVRWPAEHGLWCAFAQSRLTSIMTSQDHQMANPPRRPTNSMAAAEAAFKQTKKTAGLVREPAAAPNVRELVSIRIDRAVLDHFQEVGPAGRIGSTILCGAPSPRNRTMPRTNDQTTTDRAPHV
jgi:uncharacterized protein (DUF4415 family)